MLEAFKKFLTLGSNLQFLGDTQEHSVLVILAGATLLSTYTDKESLKCQPCNHLAFVSQ